MELGRFCGKYIRKKKKYLTGYIILKFIVAIISVLIPYFSGRYIDSLISIRQNFVVLKFSTLFFFILTIQVLCAYICSIASCKITHAISFELNFDVIEHVKKMPLLFLKNIDPIYLNKKINSDSYTIISFMLSSIIDLMINSCTLIFSCVMLININSNLGVSIILIPIYILLYKIFKNPLFKCSYELKEEESIFFSKLNDQVENIRFIKINSYFSILSEQLQVKFSKLLKCILRYQKTSYLFLASGTIINSVATLVLLFIGGLQLIKGNVTVGEFTILTSYFQQMLNSTDYFLGWGSEYQEAMVSYKRIKEILNEKIENNGSNYINCINSISLKNITFGYDDKKILEKFNYIFEKGNFYCVMGHNGAGKTTFINLILGLFDDAYEGCIVYNDICIKELDMYGIRSKLVGVVEQEPFLMNDTIISNLTYNLDDFNKEELDKWIERLGLDSFIEKLPNGLNSVIQFKANNISGGEKQKLSLIKVLLKKPQLIILDEPTSAMDIKSMDILKDILIELKQTSIVIMITHSKSFLDICDEFINFDEKDTVCILCEP